MKAVSEPANFGAVMTEWARGVPSVSGLALIGSRQRSKDDLVWAADALSDWDFQIITSRPDWIASCEWIKNLRQFEVRACVTRTTRVGQVQKISALFLGAEADFVILPSRKLYIAKLLCRLGLHTSEGWTRRLLQDLAIVIRPGYQFLKDTGGWQKFYRTTIASVPNPRISDEQARRLADGFVCDYIWTLRKIARGELLTAQRMLHRELLEVNLRMLHELKLRRSERTFPDARRFELIASPEELDSMTIESSPENLSLKSAIEKSASTVRELMASLVGNSWQWPLQVDREP